MKYLYDSKIVGYTKDFSFEKFSNTDTESLFLKNLKLKGSDWEYQSIDITYNRNSLGHREREISEIDLDNYILCVGCSYTEGIGLLKEHRYSDLIKKHLNIDVYNLGLGGAGNDLTFNNTINWINNYKKPKAIIVQWSEPSRFIRFMEAGKSELGCYGVWNAPDSRFVVDGATNNFFMTRNYFYQQLLRTIIDVPLIEMPWPKYHRPNNDKKTEVLWEIKDESRDLIHPGIKSNEIMAKKLSDMVKIELTK